MNIEKKNPTTLFYIHFDKQRFHLGQRISYFLEENWEEKESEQAKPISNYLAYLGNLAIFGKRKNVSINEIYLKVLFARKQCFFPMPPPIGQEVLCFLVVCPCFRPSLRAHI